MIQTAVPTTAPRSRSRSKGDLERRARHAAWDRQVAHTFTSRRDVDAPGSRNATRAWSETSSARATNIEPPTSRVLVCAEAVHPADDRLLRSRRLPRHGSTPSSRFRVVACARPIVRSKPMRHLPAAAVAAARTAGGQRLRAATPSDATPPPRPRWPRRWFRPRFRTGSPQPIVPLSERPAHAPRRDCRGHSPNRFATALVRTLAPPVASGQPLRRVATPRPPPRRSDPPSGAWGHGLSPRGPRQRDGPPQARPTVRHRYRRPTQPPDGEDRAPHGPAPAAPHRPSSDRHGPAPPVRSAFTNVKSIAARLPCASLNDPGPRRGATSRGLPREPLDGVRSTIRGMEGASAERAGESGCGFPTDAERS